MGRSVDKFTVSEKTLVSHLATVPFYEAYEDHLPTKCKIRKRWQWKHCSFLQVWDSCYFAQQVCVTAILNRLSVTSIHYCVCSSQLLMVVNTAVLRSVGHLEKKLEFMEVLMSAVSRELVVPTLQRALMIATFAPHLQVCVSIARPFYIWCQILWLLALPSSFTHHAWKERLYAIHHLSIRLHPFCLNKAQRAFVHFSDAFVEDESSRPNSSNGNG